MEEFIMIINKKNEGSKLTIHIEGRLDTATSPELSKELETDTIRLIKRAWADGELWSSKMCPSLLWKCLRSRAL